VRELAPEPGGGIAVDEHKERVQVFFESFGWQVGSDGEFQGIAAFKDGREVMLKYYAHTHDRDRLLLPLTGRFFLDAGCGARPFTDYSVNYRWHVCVDFTLAGLRGAREKLGERGLYVLADITQLPFKDCVFDAILCAHTLYHVPDMQQAVAVGELYRTLSTGARGIVVYSTEPYSLARRLVRLRSRAERKLAHWRGLKDSRAFPPVPVDPQAPALYYHAFPAIWFENQARAMGIEIEIRCHRLVNKEFGELFIPNNLIGSLTLSIIAFLEDRLPHVLHSASAFVTVVLNKQTVRQDVVGDKKTDHHLYPDQICAGPG